MATYESKKYAHTGANLTSIGATSIADGTVTDSEFQFINSLSSNAQTQISANLPKAGGTMTGGIVFPDDTGPAPAKLSFGAGDDLRLFSDGSTAFLKGNDIRVVNSSDAQMIKAASGGAVDLSHDGTTRISTSGSGATINGTINGSALANAYPVGSIYMNINSTDPNTLLGFGSWSRFGEGKMLVSQNSSDTDFDTGEETGGAKTHTLSEANLAAHDHLIMSTGDGFGDALENNTTNTGTTNSRGGLGNNDYIMQSVSTAANAGKTSSTGSGTAVDHMNPYIVVYMWKRTS